MSKPYKERVVWSPKHGGCLMIQRMYLDAHSSVGHVVGARHWIDWTSGCEGEYPTNDRRAFEAVRMANEQLHSTGNSFVTNE